MFVRSESVPASSNSSLTVATGRHWLAQVATAVLAFCAVVGSASAAEAEYNTYEFTPFLGYASNGDFEDPLDESERSLKESETFGLFVDIADEPWRHYEFIYSRQSSEVGGVDAIDMDVQYLHVGGIVSHPDARYVIPYFGLTVGGARFSPDLDGLDDETKLSFSAGGGVRVPFGEHFGLRLDIRAFMSLLDGDTGVFCASSPPAGGCRIAAKSDTFVQYNASLGVILAF